MKLFTHIVLGLFALLPVGVYAETKITSRDQLVTEQLPRPSHIWVYDFAATAADVPSDSALAEHVAGDSTSQTAEQIATGRKVGAELASELVKQIRVMGLPAEQATADTKPQINDIVIRGYLISVVEGSEKKRIAIGFGSGESELKVAAEGFQMTADGLRKLGSGATDSKGGKTPGAALGVAGLLVLHTPVGLIASAGIKAHEEKTGGAKIGGRAEDTAKEIADVLKKRFQEQGWID